MKIEIKWPWILRQLFLFGLLAIFYGLYKYVGEVWGFIWLGGWILSYLYDIADEQEKVKEERKEAWKNILPKRKPF